MVEIFFRFIRVFKTFEKHKVGSGGFLSNYLHFHAVFGIIWTNNRLVPFRGYRPLWEILDTPLVGAPLTRNPGSALVVLFINMY